VGGGPRCGGCLDDAQGDRQVAFTEVRYQMESKELLRQLIIQEISGLAEEGEMNPAYLKGSKNKKEREKEIDARTKEDPENAETYRSFKTDKDPKTGEPIETQTSKWTKKFNKMYGESVDSFETLLREMTREFLLLEKKRKNNVTKSLKNKAEKTGAPMSALRAIYNKGLAAWRTGHRPGASQHQWAMARVNSVLAGGPARKVDAKQWDQIKKHRGKKRKKKKLCFAVRHVLTNAL
jgi:hypothetical protein